MYGKLPEVIDIIDINVEEMFSYTYLPIKLKYGKITVEKRLHPFLELIYACEEDFLKDHGWSYYDNHYIYLTAKNLYQKESRGFNRRGWHSDSYKDNDTIYLWSNVQPTVFNSTKLTLSKDDELALKEIENKIDEKNNITYPDNSLIKLDQFCIHRVGEIIPGIRCFLKLVFSKNKFNLIGNSHNYLLDYKWKMYPRQERRNVPSIID